MPSTIEQVHREFGGQGLAVLAISIREPRERVGSWAAGRGTTVPMLLDLDGRVSQQYDVTATPTVFIVSRDGRLLGKALGTKDWMSGRGRALLATLTRT